MNDDNDDVYDRLATPSRTSPRLMINTSWLHNFHEGGGGGGYNRKEFSVRKTVYFIYLFIYLFIFEVGGGNKRIQNTSGYKNVRRKVNLFIFKNFKNERYSQFVEWT